MTGKSVTLEQYDISHSEMLKDITINPKIWEFLPRKIHSLSDFEIYIDWLADRIKNGHLIVYSILDNTSHQIIGSTGFLNLDEINKKVEIGGTWFIPEYWGTGVNAESKKLLLSSCFYDNYIVRVEFRTRDANVRSQKALEKLGAKHEGILRWDRINEDGTFRDTYVYSILKLDWDILKKNL
jgi:N-acetyltransferase